MVARACVAFVAAGVVGGCSAVSAVWDDVTAAAAGYVLPPAEEVELGEQMNAQLQEELRMHPDEELQEYVSEVGRRVAAEAERDTPEEISYEFHVVDDPETVNAFAIPGGHVYVYSGLLRMAENEAELAAVLGHEVAHVSQRHIAEQMVAAYGLQTVTNAALGEDAGTVSQLVASIVQQGSLLKYGRDAELEADEVGIDYMIESGYDPRAFISFFEKMAAQSGSGEGFGGMVESFLSTHPLPAERIERMQEILEEKGDVGGELYASRYRSIVGGAL